MSIQVPPEGSSSSKIMIVGEAPGENEVLKLRPFVGASGMELDRMLQEVGIGRNECFLTNVCRVRPPNNDISVYFAKSKKAAKELGFEYCFEKACSKEIHEGLALLKKEIELLKPNVILAFGGTPLWALTGADGIMKWRGSMMHERLTGSKFKVIPTYHPAFVLRTWSARATAINDLRRAARFRHGADYPTPQWKFTTSPTFKQVIGYLEYLHNRATFDRKLRISFDIETKHGHITCAGISWNLEEAICIPFTCIDRLHYWSLEEEAAIVHRICKVLTHPAVEVVGQNILYDCQYTYRHWHCTPRVAQDTMISQHSIFSDLPKNLGYQASMYCNYYYYWKDEGKEWKETGKKKTHLDEIRGWRYNCQDCVYTDEVGQTELRMIDSMSKKWPLLPAIHAFQQKLFWPVLQTMQLGVRVNEKKRGELILEVQEHLAQREQVLISILGHPINPRSPKQMMKLFYEDFKLPKQMTRAKKGQPSRPTLDDDALQKLGRIEPLVKPIINCIADIRTLGIFLSNFLLKPLDTDGRMRCSYNIGGSESGKSAPKTYRLSSSENAFGSGGNLQNVPSQKSKAIGKAAARGNMAVLGDPYSLPNIRSMFVPDPGYTFFDGDLDRADLQVVVYEAEDEMLKAALKMGADIHLLNSFILENKEPPPMDELVESHPKYADHRRPMSFIREFAKVFCHGTNYGGQPRTMAANTGRTVHDIDRAQKIWFGAHPGIKRWQGRIKDQVTKFRFVENKFGYRWYIFDRVDSIIPEAIAWIPQSTVSIVINKIWMNLYENVPEAQVLLQVHDSLAGQFLSKDKDYVVRKINENSKIVVPYEDPLVIPFGLKTSEISWGECK